AVNSESELVEGNLTHDQLPGSARDPGGYGCLELQAVAEHSRDVIPRRTKLCEPQIEQIQAHQADHGECQQCGAQRADICQFERLSPKALSEQDEALDS